MDERQQYLIAIVGADITQFRKGMRDVRSEIGFLNEDTSSSLGKLGRTLTYTLTTPLLAAGTVITKSASDFDAAMRNINSIALLSEDQFGNLSDEVLKFGKTTREGVNAAAESLYTLYSAGLTGSLAFDVMTVATKTAEAGLADLTITSEALTAAMLSYGFTTEEEAWRASNALTKMVQVGVGSMESFAGSIATFMPSAAALKVPIEEAFALTARLTQMGYSAAEASVRVNAAMRSMIKPSEAMTAAFNELGVKSTSELIAKYGGLTEALIALRGTTDGTEESLAALFSDTRALQGVLLFTQDVERTRATLKEFNKGLDTATMDAWEQQAMSFSFQFDRAKTAVGALAITLGQHLLPVIAPLLNAFTDWVLALTTMDSQTGALTVALGVMAAALPPLIWLFSSMLSPLGLIVAGVVGVKNAFDTNFAGIATTIKSAVDAALVAIEPLRTALQALIDDFFGEGATPIGVHEDGSPMIGAGMSQEMLMGGSLNIPIPVSYTVEEGDSFWQIWSDHFREKYPTFDNFMAATGMDVKAIIHPGDVINIGGSVAAIGNTVGDILAGGVDMAYANMSDEYLTEKPADFWGRLGWAISKNAQSIKAGLDQALVNLKPVIDEFGGQLFNQLAAAFSPTGSTGMGDTWLYDTLIGGIEGGAAVFNGGFAETFPNLAAGINNFMANLGDWMLEEGLPTISRTVGYIAGTIGVLLAQGLAEVWNYLTGGGAGDGASQFGESIGTPFIEGVSDAMANAGVADVADQIVAGIAGTIATAAIAKYGLFTVAATAIDKGMGLAFTGFKWAAGYIVANGLIGVLSAGLGAITTAAAFVSGLAGLTASLASTIGGAIMGAIPAIIAAAGGFLAAVGATLAGVVTAIVTSPITFAISVGIIISHFFFEPINEFWDKSGIRGHVQTWANDLEMRVNDMLDNPDSGGISIRTGVRDYSIYFDDKTNVTVDTAALETSPAWATAMTALNETIAGAAATEETKAAVVESSDAIVTGLADNISTFIADGIIEENEVSTAISEPIFNALNPVFGEGGTVRLMWQGFVADFLMGVSSITLQSGLLALTIPAAFGLLKIRLDPVIDAIIAKLDELVVKMQQVQGAGGSITLPSGDGVLPTTVPNGTTGGVDNPPVGTQGSEPMLPQEIFVEQSTSSQSHNSKDTINIYGITDVTGVIKELARRGKIIERRT